MKKNLAASIVALSLMFVPGYAQSGQGDTNTSGAPAATTGVDSGSQPSGGDQTNIDVQAPSMPAPGGNTESTTVNAAPPVSVPAPDVNVDVQAPAPSPASAPSSTTIHVDAPPAVTAPSPSSTTVVRESSSRVVQVDDHEDDTNWGLIVGAGLIGLTVVALVLSSRRTV